MLSLHALENIDYNTKLFVCITELIKMIHANCLERCYKCMIWCTVHAYVINILFN